jgi:hypothetical protein
MGQNDFNDIKISLLKKMFFKIYVYNEYMTVKMDEAIVFSFSEPIL